MKGVFTTLKKLSVCKHCAHTIHSFRTRNSDRQAGRLGELGVKNPYSYESVLKICSRGRKRDMQRDNQSSSAKVALQVLRSERQELRDQKKKKFS